MKLMVEKSGASYQLEDEDSDEYGALSSADEEEDDPMMAQFQEKEEEQEDEEDFAKEMDAEIEQGMSIMLQRKKVEKKEAKQEFYDDVYFNSSDEEGVQKEEKKIKTNDELFYDPTLDDLDEKWVSKKRKKYLKPGKENAKDSMEDTSATLSCPACMTVLCRDCQQHETYHHQFRAMFVFNCLVLTTETLTYEVKSEKRKRSKPGSTSEQSKSENFNPVKCSVCQTKVGVFDSEEVYHFFNVLAT